MSVQESRVAVEPPQKKTKFAAQKELGRPPKNWEQKAASTKRDYVLKLCDQLKRFPIDCVVPAFIKMLKESKKSKLKSMSLIVKDAWTSPDTGSMVAKIRKPITKTRMLSPFEGLSMLFDADLSKRQYLKVRELAALCGISVFPSYDRVRTAKDDCRPPLESSTITEKSASYTLATLAEFTAFRIVDMQQEVIHQNQTRKNINSEVCTMTFSCGFDGSCGHSNYKQKYVNDDAGPNDDSSIFATTLVPLRLQSSSGEIYWQNATPQSIRFCRPIKIQFAKESKQLILDEKKSLDDQIRDLEDIEIDLDDGNKITIKFLFYISMIDGKVLSVITDTKSSQSCPFCSCTPNDFNVKENMESGKFNANKGSLVYGISPLHAYIRCMEWLLHVSYKLEFKKWQARSQEEKESTKARKKLIQQNLWDRMALRVDFPNASGSGTSNDGNTARRAFEDFETFAQILGIEVKIVRMVRIILIALNCQLPINAERFKSYCFQLFEEYLKHYSWYKLPASVHKILAHGSQIVSATSLPLGMIGEEGAEARNKVYKSDREYHARKSSRYNTMYDIFFRAIDSSDPILSTQSFKSRLNSKSKRETLPLEVVELLEVPDPKNVCSQNSNPVEVETFEFTVADFLDDIVLDSECEVREQEQGSDRLN